MISNNSIAALVRKNEQTYTSNTPTYISKYVDFDMNETISKIEAYINSKHTTGDTDALGREKPFFNICTSARNIWYRATDIDRKNISITSDTAQDTLGALMASIHLQSYMRRDAFGQFLNEWGRVLATYGSAVCKFVEKDGRMHSEVVPWNRLIVDQVDFDNDIVIEVLELTPAQLKQRKGYDQELVDELLSALETRKTLDKRSKDTKVEFIKVYEVHGNIALSYLTGNSEDDDKFVQQMHVISFVKGKEKGKYDDYTLISGKEAKNPYMITHLIKEDGRTLAIGAVEHLFNAQWMQNWSVKTIKDQLDLASKLIFQTSDGNFVGMNALNAIENGDILIHEANEPLTQVQNNSHDITSVQSYASQWKALGNEINGISEAMMGQNPPAGSAWRQTEALLQESHSLFELMTENKGLYIEQMIREYHLPFIKKTYMNSTKQVIGLLNDMGVKEIETKYIKNKAIKRKNNAIVEEFRRGGSNFNINQDAMESQVKDELQSHGNQRYFTPSEQPDKTWKDAFDSLEWDVNVDVTGESKDKQAALATINTLMQMVIAKQGQPMTPEEAFLFNKGLMLSGEVSPIEFANVQREQEKFRQEQSQIQAQQPMQPPQAPQPTQPIGTS